MTELKQETLEVLKSAHWYQTRNVETNLWKKQLEARGYLWFPEVERVLSRYGGLKLDGKNALPFAISRETGVINGIEIDFHKYPYLEFNPLDAPDSDSDAASIWMKHPYLKNQSLRIMPVGTLQAIYTVFLTSNGKVFLGIFQQKKDYKASLQPEGDSFEEFLNNSVMSSLYYV